MKAISADKLLDLKLPERDYIMAPWLVAGTQNLVYGAPGVGKTFFCLPLAAAAATGASFLRWKAGRPRKVLYIDGEMGAAEIQKRLKQLRISDCKLLFTVSDLNDYGLPDLASPDGQEEYERLIDQTGAELIIFDNLSCLCRSAADENSAESWLSIQNWGGRLRNKVTILYVHHAGKAGQQRGTSKREDNMRSIIRLAKPPLSGTKCDFEVHFQKSSFAFGLDVEPFRATLSNSGQWQY